MTLYFLNSTINSEDMSIEKGTTLVATHRPDLLNRLPRLKDTKRHECYISQNNFVLESSIILEIFRRSSNAGCI